MPLKQQVSVKLETILAELRSQLAARIQAHPGIPVELKQSLGKITRGENYQAYAYRVLDYPARFSADGVFTFRTLVLWGHHVGFHLILSGAYLQSYGPAIRSVNQPSFFWDQRESPWEWFRQQEMPLSTLSVEEKEKQGIDKGFVRINAYLPLEAYHRIPAFGMQFWEIWQTALWPVS